MRQRQKIQELLHAQNCLKYPTLRRERMPVIGWLLNMIYAALLLAIAPVVIYRMIAQGKYRAGWGQKLLGTLPPQPESDRPRLWLHAVSVGEVMQLVPVVAALRERHPEASFVISTTTTTGWDVAQKKFPEAVVCYLPLDFTWAVRRALSQIRPTALVLVELELWPNLIRTASQQGIPVVLINGRVSEKSFHGYRRIRFLLRGILGRFHTLAVQNETYAERLRQLGASTDRLHVTGSIKFDAIETDRENPCTTALRRSFGFDEGDIVFIAGSTQAPEEDYAISTYQQLRLEFPRLRLLLVPRHQERFEEVARLVAERGLPLIRRSQILAGESHNSDSGSVRMLDTLGELSACWGIADIAFVGGSLTNRGGQNMIEPAGYGAAVLFGPNTHNFRDVVELLLKEQAARVVAGPEELTNLVREFLLAPESCRQLGTRAQQLVLEQRGATARTVDLICGAAKLSGATAETSRARAA